MPNAITVELLAAGDVTGSGSGAAVDIESPQRRALQLEVLTAPVVGEPIVAVSVESRISSTAPWRTVLEPMAIEEAGQATVYVYGSDQYVRASYEVLGGATVHLAITARALVLYCVPRDIGRFALPANLANVFEPHALLAACFSASSIADGYLASSYTGPITAWDDDLRGYTAKIASAELLRHRGVDPDGPDRLVFDAEKDAIRWLDRIANGRLKPPGIVDSTPEEFEGGSVVVSGGINRGWS